MLAIDLSERVCLVTGANAGIGYITARELARAGARVILACRSEEKGRAAIERIASETGVTTVEYLQLDLADLGNVKAAAEKFLSQKTPLHLLINNAGLAGSRGQTAQGFEIQFGVNHLGPYLFTRLLLPALESSTPARIVNVASRGHLKARGIDFDAVTRSTRTVAGFKEYCVSKLANVLFSMELANRLPDGVTTYALHPGVIKSEIWRRIPWPYGPWSPATCLRSKTARRPVCIAPRCRRSRQRVGRTIPIARRRLSTRSRQRHWRASYGSAARSGARSTCRRWPIGPCKPGPWDGGRRRRARRASTTRAPGSFAAPVPCEPSVRPLRSKPILVWTGVRRTRAMKIAEREP